MKRINLQIDDAAHAILEAEAKRQKRTVANLSSVILAQEAERLTAQERKTAKKAS